MRLFGRRWHLQPYFFSSKISIIPFLTASVFVSLLSLQYCKSFKFVSASIRIFRLIDLGLSIFGLPVRGLIESPLFLCTTNYSIHYVHQKVNPQSEIKLYKNKFSHLCNLLKHPPETKNQSFFGDLIPAGGMDNSAERFSV